MVARSVLKGVELRRFEKKKYGLVQYFRPQEEKWQWWRKLMVWVMCNVIRLMSSREVRGGGSRMSRDDGYRSWPLLCCSGHYHHCHSNFGKWVDNQYGPWKVFFLVKWVIGFNSSMAEIFVRPLTNAAKNIEVGERGRIPREGGVVPLSPSLFQVICIFNDVSGLSMWLVVSCSLRDNF